MSLFKTYKITDLVGDRFSYVVAGPPGTGKSTLCGSMAKNMKTVLLATLSREAASWQYKENQANIDVVPLWEHGWKADVNGAIDRNVKVDGLARFNAVVAALRNDEEYDAVILDNGTELAEMAWHAAMLPHGVVDPSFMEGERSRFMPYSTLDTSLDSAVKALTMLTNAETAKRPKYVGITWHVQPPKEDQTEKVEGGKVKKESADNKGEGTEYEGTVLPAIRGKFRRRLAGQVDAFVFTDIIHVNAGRETVPRYVIQIRPDADRHSKIPGPLATAKHIPNDFDDLLKVVKEGKLAEQTTPASEASENGKGKSSFRTR